MDRAAYTLADQQRMTRAKNYFAWQAALALPHLGRRVLEVGAGIGNFTELLLDREFVAAIDIEPACIDALKRRFPGRGNLIAAIGDASTGLADLAPHRLDSCVCLNVLEHIGNDVETLRNIAGILTPGGSIVLIVPAFPGLSGPIDRNLGHHRRYTQASLREAARAAGLRIREMQYLNLPGFFGWWLNARVLRREEQSERQIEIFDRLIVPAIARLDVLLPPPFGQSLFAVLGKLH
jgi:SAM-dependent methyltransferase